MRDFNNLLVLAQFLIESLNSLIGIFLVVFMMLDLIFSKIIGHSILHSVAFGGVKACV